MMVNGKNIAKFILIGIGQWMKMEKHSFMELIISKK